MWHQHRSTVTTATAVCGDVQLNPGPSDDEVKCASSSNKESGQKLQCEQCLHWLHCKCVNMSSSVAKTYPYTCPFCVKSAITTFSSVHSEICLLNDHLSQLEAAKYGHKLQDEKDDLGSIQVDLG